MAGESENQWERQRDFLLEQQARFMADMEAMKKKKSAETDQRVAANAAQIERNTQNIARLVDVCMSLANDQPAARRDMAELRQRMRENDEDTRYKLNALIATVDKLSRGNGAH
jgi:hypothetical protein